ncbi:MAG: PIN domain-containing protein, partial [Desulfurellaceae bacterium]|nr:PIN domain-containing protein [Desulfurellaceae bacterium]
MKDKTFIDTNIWIYSLVESNRETDRYKREVSLKLLENLVKENFICMSIQVVNECHWNFVRKFKLEDKIAIKTIEDNILQIAEVYGINLSTYELSHIIRQKYKVSFWDSLMTASALENGCNILYTEDMQHGQIIEDSLKIINPIESVNS